MTDCEENAADGTVSSVSSSTAPSSFNCSIALSIACNTKPWNVLYGYVYARQIHYSRSGIFDKL